MEPRQTTSTALTRRPATGLSLTTLDEMKGFAHAAFCAGLMGSQSDKTTAIARAVVAIQYGAEVGLGPMSSIQGINVIQGKPAMGAGMIATLVKRSGRYNYRVTKHTNDCCTIQFTENGEPCGESTFTMQDAVTAGLTKNPLWKTVPKNMVFARAMSNGAKWYCGDIFSGSVYTPEELDPESPQVWSDEVDADGVVAEQEPPGRSTGKPVEPSTAELADQAEAELRRMQDAVQAQDDKNKKMEAADRAQRQRELDNPTWKVATKVDKEQKMDFSKFIPKDAREREPGEEG